MVPGKFLQSKQSKTMQPQDESLKNGLKARGTWRAGRGRSQGSGRGSRKMFLNAGSTSVKVFF